jgi:hypothetical protein
VIESATEFAIAVVKQKPEALLPVGGEHQQVSRLLCDPAPIWMACARDELDPTTLERDEEQDVDAVQPDRFDRQEVASEQRRCLLAPEHSPAQPVSFGCRWHVTRRDAQIGRGHGCPRRGGELGRRKEDEGSRRSFRSVGVDLLRAPLPA